MVPPAGAPLRGNEQGNAQGNEMPRANGWGCGKNKQGGCGTHPFHSSPSLFGFFVLDRPTRTAPAERERKGAPPVLTAAAVRRMGGVWHAAWHAVWHIPPAFVGVAPFLICPCRKAPPPARVQDDEPRRVGWFYADRRRHVLVVRVALAGSVPRR